MYKVFYKINHSTNAYLCKMLYINELTQHTGSKCLTITRLLYYVRRPMKSTSLPDPAKVLRKKLTYHVAIEETQLPYKKMLQQSY